jgi:hypothetical protein
MAEVALGLLHVLLIRPAIPPTKSITDPFRMLRREHNSDFSLGCFTMFSFSPVFAVIQPSAIVAIVTI